MNVGFWDGVFLGFVWTGVGIYTIYKITFDVWLRRKDEDDGDEHGR